jgi:chromate transporter
MRLKPTPRVTLPALFVTFLQMSLCAFGGGLPWARYMVVERRGWLNEQEFAEILALCQFLPGPNIASITLCVGFRLRGAAGAIAALSGFIVIPWIIGFAIGALWLQYADRGVLQGLLRGISAAAAGLIIATGIKLLMPHRGRPGAFLFAALAFAGLAFAKLPLLAVVLGLTPLSIAAALFERPKPG